MEASCCTSLIFPTGFSDSVFQGLFLSRFVIGLLFSLYLAPFLVLLGYLCVCVGELGRAVVLAGKAERGRTFKGLQPNDTFPLDWWSKRCLLLAQLLPFSHFRVFFCFFFYVAAPDRAFMVIAPE